MCVLCVCVCVQTVTRYETQALNMLCNITSVSFPAAGLEVLQHSKTILHFVAAYMFASPKNSWVVHVRLEHFRGCVSTYPVAKSCSKESGEAKMLSSGLYHSRAQSSASRMLRLLKTAV